MKWRVVVELAGADGTVQSHEIGVGGCGTIDHSADTLGLTLAEGKKTLAGLQRHLVQAHCVKKARKRHAVREMEVDPSEPLCRRRLQTAMSCFGQKPRW
jgi:hypothetical protein